MDSMVSLKGRNVLLIWAVLACDAAIIISIAFPSVFEAATISSLGIARLASATIAPVIVFFLSSLIPSDIKAVLVFWRLTDALPGHRAFSVYATKDPRIDLGKLKANIGAFPDTARNQNSMWYSLYRKIQGDVIVATANRQFLLFRDIAAISILLTILVPEVLWALDSSGLHIVYVEGLFVAQYIAAMIAARNHGIRLVTNVLAVHSSRRIR